MRIGFVGPGQLGLPMVERLTAAGNDVLVHARRAEVRQEVEAVGANATDDLAAVGTAADVLLVCLFSDDQLKEVGPALLASMRPGTVLASHVTGRISTIRALAREAAEHGVAVVDAGLSGHADDIRAGRLTVVLGGEEKARHTVEDVIAAYASPVVHAGPVGSSLAVKMVNNMLLTANLQILAQAIDLATELGTSEDAFLTVLETSSGGSYASMSATRMGGLDIFAEKAGVYLRKDVAVCREQAAELGLDPGLLGEVVSRGRLPLENR